MDALNKIEMIYRNEINRFRIDAAPEQFTQRCRPSDTRYESVPEEQLFFELVSERAKTVENDFRLSQRDAVSVIACANELSDAIVYASTFCGVENLFAAEEYISYLSGEGNRLIRTVYDSSDETARSATALLTRFFRTAHAVVNISLGEGMSVLKTLRCFLMGKQWLEEMNTDRIQRTLEEEGATVTFTEDDEEEEEFEIEEDDWDKDYVGMPSADLLLEDLDEDAETRDEEHAAAANEEEAAHERFCSKSCSYVIHDEKGREALIDITGQVLFDNVELEKAMDSFTSAIVDFARGYVPEHFPNSVEVSDTVRLEWDEDDPEAPEDDEEEEILF